MKEYFVYGTNLAETYHCSLVGLQKEGEIVPCPDYNMRMFGYQDPGLQNRRSIDIFPGLMYSGDPKDLDLMQIIKGDYKASK